MSADLLDACGKAVAGGGLQVSPVLGEVTCGECKHLSIVPYAEAREEPSRGVRIATQVAQEWDKGNLTQGEAAERGKELAARETHEVTDAEVEPHEHAWQPRHDGHEVCTDCPEAAESDGNHYRRAAREVSRA